MEYLSSGFGKMRARRGEGEGEGIIKKTLKEKERRKEVEDKDPFLF